MIKINLISNEDKESLKWEKISRMVISYAMKIVIIQIFFVLSLALTVVYLDFEKENAKSELVLVESTKETMEIKKMEDSLKKYEKNMKIVTNIHQNHIGWIDVFDSFSLLVTRGIKINSVRFKPFENVSAATDKKSKKVTIDDRKYILEVKGDALKREDLMIFEKKLNESEIYKMMETGEPAYNKYVNSENINFEFNFEVLKEDLVKVSKK